MTTSYAIPNPVHPNVYSFSVAGERTRIGSPFLRGCAALAGRDDLAQRIDDIEARGARYSGEDGDVLAAVWTALGWPMPAVR